MNIALPKQRRIQRVRAKVRGTVERPRLSVHRTNMHIYAQVIDDVKGRTLVAASSQEILRQLGTSYSSKSARDDKAGLKSLSALSIAGKIGELVAEKAKKRKISKVNFDRGPFAYHGRVKAVAEGARRGGLEF